MLKKILIFLVINFTALAIGGFYTGSGVSSDWYESLNKAPWTPPGWVFGAAWTFIMICFAFFMAYLWNVVKDKKNLIILFGIQWVLNVIWNPIFFSAQEVTLGLITISLLTVLVGYFFFSNLKKMGLKSLLISPYLIWLLIATSLNAYVLFNN